MHRIAAHLRAFFLHRPNRPLVLLLVSMALACAALFDAQRAVRSNRAMAGELLSGYGSFAAWSYAQAADAALDSLAWATLGPVIHEHPHPDHSIPHPAVLVHYRPYDPRGEGHRPWPHAPSFLFGYRLDEDTVRAVRNALGDHRGEWRVDSLAALSAADRALARDSVRAHLRARWRPGWRYALFTAGTGQGRRLVAYTLMPTESGVPVLYGAVVEHAELMGLLRGAFERQALLPGAITRGLPNDSILSLAVFDARGAPVLVTRAEASWDFAADEALPPVRGGLRVRAAVRPAMASQLAVGGLPRSRVPLLLGVLGLAAVLSLLAAGQLRREGELARLRADFVASVSHELRTPLAQVRLFVETLLLGRAATDEQRRWALGNIDRETTRLAHLVDNVLLFSRAGRRQAPLPLARAELDDEVAHAVRAFEPLAAVKRAAIRTALRPVAARVHAESVRQVLVNLLDNAVKYGPPGQTVAVTLSADGDSARLEVSDQGPGVPPAEREAVWKPFFRGEGSAVRAVGGSGIGLSVVRDLVAAHGGRAWVEDAPGGGARFVVLFPRDGAGAEPDGGGGPRSASERSSIGGAAEEDVPALAAEGR